MSAVIYRKSCQAINTLLKKFSFSILFDYSSKRCVAERDQIVRPDHLRKVIAQYIVSPFQV